jgi:biopolymer transport protein ExbD/biopolymer transport protein TolR
MAYKPKAPEVVAAINVIPMADIMLVLLIIFMVVTPMLQKGISVDLAPVANPRDMPDQDKEDAITVAVTRSGDVFLGQELIAKGVSKTTTTGLEQLAPKIRDLIANRLDKTVFVKADSGAKYGAVVTVIDEVRAAGVDQLGLLTEKVKPKTAAPPPPPTGGEN